MPVPANITLLSTAAASNSPPGTESPALVDDYLRAQAAFIAQLRAVIGGATDANIPNAIVKQTSVTDTTAGALMAVGAFGLGGTAPLLVTDANAVPAGGSICVLSTPFTNGPTATFYTLYSALNGASAGSQLAVPYATGTSSYTRTRIGGVWSGWVQVATSLNSLGQGQTWQDMTASRALYTTYTNSTGRPIDVVVGGSPSASTAILVSGTLGATFRIASTSAGTAFTSSAFTVPAGATYSVHPFSGTVSTLSWAELR